MENYASAPYNFIPFPKSVVYRHFIKDCIEESDKPKLKAKDIDELVYHDKFYSNLKTGYIDYKIVTKSPMFVGDGKGNFFKVNNICTIPGATMRGRVRSNAEVLSCAYPEFINDKKLWYRAPFAKTDDALKELYRSALALNKKGAKITDKVKAGYLTNKNGKYTIIPAVEDESGRSFRDINEGELRNKLKKIEVKDGLVKYMYVLGSGSGLWKEVGKLKFDKKRLKKEFKEKMKYGNKKQLNEERKKEENTIKYKIRELFKCNEKRQYEPYFVSLAYEIDNQYNELKINSISKFEYDENCGILMNSSKVNGSNKQNHYIIYKPDESKRKLFIDNGLKVSFHTSIKYMKNISDKFNLPDNDKYVPVFYVLDKKNEKVQSFGFTPYLKVTYQGSVLDGITMKEEYKGKCVDYVQSIFGFTNFESTQDEISYTYKGRVRFTNAKIINNKGNMDEIFKTLMNPKINSFQLYLKQDKNDISSLNNYDKNFELRGQKFYWMKEKADIESESKDKKEQLAELAPIEMNAEFKGRIYFENLAYDELGLLLMSLKPYEEAVDNIGQGKPYGFGKIKVDILDVKEIKMSNRFTKLNCNEIEDINTEECKKAFENQMQKSLGCNFKDTEIYKYFCLSKNGSQIPKDDEIKYMDLCQFKERKILKPIEAYQDEYEKSK